MAAQSRLSDSAQADRIRAGFGHSRKETTVHVQKKCIENSDEPAERTGLYIAHWAIYACGQWDSEAATLGTTGISTVRPGL